MYAATGDARFKERADYIVREMKEVQDKHGDGYLGALANGKEQFIEVSKGNIRSGGFDLNGLWAPWYVLHKTYAGLRDAYRYTGNRAALDVEIKFAAWAEGILAKLDDAQIAEDAQHRVRRHERSAGRPLRRHGRQALARSFAPLRSSRRARSARAPARTSCPDCTATRRCRRLHGSPGALHLHGRQG